MSLPRYNNNNEICAEKRLSFDSVSAPASAEVFRFRISIVGVVINRLVTIACFFGAFTAARGLLHDHGRPAVVLFHYYSLFLACFLQIIFSTAIFSKSFLNSLAWKFVRFTLGAFIPLCFVAVLMSGVVWVKGQNNWPLVVVVCLPVVYAAFYLPYYLVLTDEQCPLRPFVRIQ